MGTRSDEDLGACCADGQSHTSVNVSAGKMHSCGMTEARLFTQSPEAFLRLTKCKNVRWLTPHSSGFIKPVDLRRCLVKGKKDVCVLLNLHFTFLGHRLEPVPVHLHFLSRNIPGSFCIGGWVIFSLICRSSLLLFVLRLALCNMRASMSSLVLWLVFLLCFGSFALQKALVFI